MRILIHSNNTIITMRILLANNSIGCTFVWQSASNLNTWYGTRYLGTIVSYEVS